MIMYSVERVCVLGKVHGVDGGDADGVVKATAGESMLVERNNVLDDWVATACPGC
jgi:hypothetical protein